MTAAYIADTDGLGLGRPDHEPLAGETMGPIIAMIAALIDKGSAYAVDGDVYFRVRSDPRYGELSHRVVDDMDQGEGVEGADLKEDPLDFALWKAQKPGEDTAWDAPWGRGRPGWHIECSAMAEELLGVGFDIHGGGNDLIFPHHENEAAQTRMAHGGADLAQIWMHNGMLQMGEEKMAKSVGNIALLGDVLERWGRDAVVLFFSTGHYRQPLRFSEETLGAAQGSVRRIREAARRLAPGAPSPADLQPLVDRFFDALADDFNTPRALEALWEWVREANKREDVGDAALREMLTVLGLETLLDAGDDDAPDHGGPGAAGGPRGGARGPRLGRGRPPARRAGRARLAGARLRRRPRARAPVILYGRNAVHEALRARRRRVHEIWATASVAGARALGARGRAFRSTS